VNRKLFLLFGLLLTGTAFGQAASPVVGATAEVEGLVTMSVGTNVSNVAGTVSVIDGSRFVTASTGSVTLKFADGCIVKLNPNQSLVVDNSRPCAARIAAVQVVGTATAGSGAIGPLGAGALLGLGIAAVNSGGRSGGTAGGGGSGGSGGGGGGGEGGGIPNLPPSGQ
jgi:hypothetical protein